MVNAQTETGTHLSIFRRVLRNTWFRVVNRQTISIWVACTVLAAFSGPFGTYEDFSFAKGLYVWGILLAYAIFTAFLMCEIIEAVLENYSETTVQITFFVFGSIAISFVVDLLLAFWLDQTADVRPTFSLLLAYVMSITAVIMVIRNLIPNFDRVETSPQVTEDKALVEPSQVEQTRLAQRLNIPKEHSIIHMCADGHFVEVKTTMDSYRVRMRFSDAVAELDGSKGLTVHRSHWVYRNALRGWAPNASKPYVVLETGVQVPVSKSNIAKIKSLELSEIPCEKAS